MLPAKQNQNYCWYPDEEICRKRKGLPAWVKQQRKIAKKAKLENHGLYFLLEMLEVPFRVTRGVKGLDADRPLEKESQQLKTWHKKYKGTRKRNLSPEVLKKKRESLALARKAKKVGKLLQSKVPHVNEAVVTILSH